MTSQLKSKTVRPARNRSARRSATSARGVRSRPVNHSQTAAAIPAPPPVALSDMGDLLRRAADTARKSHAENTQRSYKSALRMFAEFAASKGQAVFPADPRTVAAFLQHRIDAGAAPGSLNVALSAIRHAHARRKNRTRPQIRTSAPSSTTIAESEPPKAMAPSKPEECRKPTSPPLSPSPTSTRADDIRRQRAPGSPAPRPCFWARTMGQDTAHSRHCQPGRGTRRRAKYRQKSSCR